MDVDILVWVLCFLTLSLTLFKGNWGKFSHAWCHTPHAVKFVMHLLARDEGGVMTPDPDPGDSWPGTVQLSRVSHRLHPLQWPPADHWTWNVGSSALYWFWFGLGASEPCVGRSLVSDRVKEVQGWVWRECGDPAAAANWATCATCQVWWLEKLSYSSWALLNPKMHPYINVIIRKKILEQPLDTKHIKYIQAKIR